MEAFESIQLFREHVPDVGTYLVLQTDAKRAEITKEPISICMMLDISGSMMPYMKHVYAMAATAIERLKPVYGSFQLYTFDEEVYTILEHTIVSQDNEAILLSRLRESLVNHQKRTNIYAALSKVFEACTKHPSTDVIFMTDGLANMGLYHVSRDLYHYAYAHPTFGTARIHTLGVQIDNSRLNAFLLRELALETCGTYRVATQESELGAFLGDVMAHARYTRMRNLKFLVHTPTGSACHELSKRPKHGHTLREDAPLSIVFDDRNDALYHVQYLGQLVPNTFVSANVTLLPIPRNVQASTLQTIAFHATEAQVVGLKAYIRAHAMDPQLLSNIEKTLHGRLHPELDDDIEMSQHAYATMTQTPLRSREVLQERDTSRQLSLAHTHDPM